jgi:UDP-glucose 4-epimerase
MRYLITGGAGFIGSHVVDTLVARGHNVRIVDDFSTGQRANIEALVASGAVQLVEGSVVDEALVDELMRECDRCMHLASTVGVKLVVARPLDTLRTIVQGTDVVISAAARHDKRVLYASTSEVYGKASDDALSEDSDRVLGSTFKSRWSYAIAKSYGEAIAHGYHRDHGTETMVARMFNTIGPRQRGRYGMVVPRLVNQALAGEELTVYGDGTQTRCFLHVRDAVAGLLALIEHDGAVGRAFNVGNPVSISIAGLAERIIERTGSSSEPSFIPYELAYDEGFEELGRRRPDIHAISELTRWRPQRSLDEALDEVIAYQQTELALGTGVGADVPAAAL